MTAPADAQPVDPIVPNVYDDRTNTAGTKRTLNISYTWRGQPIDLHVHIRVTGTPPILVDDIAGTFANALKHMSDG